MAQNRPNARAASGVQVGGGQVDGSTLSRSCQRMLGARFRGNRVRLRVPQHAKRGAGRKAVFDHGRYAGRCTADGRVQFESAFQSCLRRRTVGQRPDDARLVRAGRKHRAFGRGLSAGIGNASTQFQQLWFAGGSQVRSSCDEFGVQSWELNSCQLPISRSGRQTRVEPGKQVAIRSNSGLRASRC